MKDIVKDRFESHLKYLIQLLKNNDDANIEYYLKMKQHHSYINGKIEGHWDTPMEEEE